MNIYYYVIHTDIHNSLYGFDSTILIDGKPLASFYCVHTHPKIWYVWYIGRLCTCSFRVHFTLPMVCTRYYRWRWWWWRCGNCTSDCWAHKGSNEWTNEYIDPISKVLDINKTNEYESNSITGTFWLKWNSLCIPTDYRLSICICARASEWFEFNRNDKMCYGIWSE